MTNAGWNKLDDSLISLLQLTIKLEDAIKMLESPQKTYSQTNYFSWSIQFNNWHIGMKSSHYVLTT